tara:strand:- start:95056 stop:96519 length:1464 start_codon:yes stop_codon:yes gene_type:complete
MFPCGLLYAKPVAASASTQTKAATKKLTEEIDSLQPGAKLTLTLPEAIAIALRKNPAIRSDYLNQINSKLTLQVAKQQFIPQASLGMTASAQDNDLFGSSQNYATVSPGMTWNTPLGTSFTATWNNTFQSHNLQNDLNVTMTQPLWQGLGVDVNEVALKNAKDTAELAKLTLKSSIISTVTTVISDYFATQSDELSLISSVVQMKTDQTDVLDTQRKIKAGTQAPAEIYSVQSQYAQQQGAVQSAHNTLQQGQITLANELGLRQGVIIEVPTKVVIPKIVPNMALCQKLALVNSNTYASDIITLRTDQRDLLTAMDAERWKINLTANAQVGDNTQPTPIGGGSNTLNTEGDTVGLNVTIPLGAARATLHNAVAAAKITEMQSVITLNNEKRTLYNTIQTDIQNIQSDLQTISINERSLKYQKLVVKATREKLIHGLASNFQLTTEQTTLNTDIQSVITAKSTYLTALSQLDSDIGTTLETWHVKVNY